MNKSDSERVAAVLNQMKYKPATTIKEADLIIVNMCSVRQTAVDRVYGLAPKFKKLKQKKPDIKTVLTGCVLKKDQQKLKNIFDFILPIKTLEFWPEILKKKQYFLTLNQRGQSFTQGLKVDYLKICPSYRKSFSVFIPISTGCNNFCSYCVVPFTRGPLICRPHQDILKEIKTAVKNGAKEIWLLGQNVNDYHSPTDPSIDFPKLLEMANNIPGNFWLSFTSSHPKDFSEKLIDVMKKCKKITEYLSLPIQSGDDEILKKMNRPYTVKEYKKLVKKIRKKIPEIALSTDIIVGFPGEKKKHFKNTLKFFKEMKFDMAYIAQYSQRAGTKASKMKDDVSKKEKERRWKELTEILKSTALEKNKKYIGKEIEVLISEYKMHNNKHFYFGKTRTYKTVKIEAPKDMKTILLGNFVKVRIVDALPWGLKGVLKK